MTIRYFYAPLTCSLGGMIALEEVGCRYEAVEVNLSGDRSALLAVSAAGRVPTLVADREVVTETIAILAWLHHRFPGAAVLPKARDDFVRTISILSWCASSLHIARRRFARPAMFAATSAAQQEVSNAAEALYRAGLDELDGAVAEAPRSLGLHAYALVFLQWALIDGIGSNDLPNLRRIAGELAHGAGTRRALSAHRTPELMPSRAAYSGELMEI